MLNFGKLNPDIIFIQFCNKIYLRLIFFNQNVVNNKIFILKKLLK
jgi:hypothetical protein